METVVREPSEREEMSELISWREIDQLVDLLVQSLSHRPFDVIVGITRSGLIPAVMLSHRTGVRPFFALDIRRTQSDEKNAPKLAPALIGHVDQSMLRGQRVLLVDDIVGEGLTMQLAKEVLGAYAGSVISAALVVNQQNLAPRRPDDVVDVYGCLVHGWVTFPWENQWQGSA